jgi:uncharacterized protein YndB with AHSA1/START domain
MTRCIEKTVFIKSNPATVWEYLTDPSQMKKWMGEPEMNIEIHTDWLVQNPILITGFHHVEFQNKGTVLRFEPHKILQYTHLSSISQLPHKKDNFTTLTFVLIPTEGYTSLTIKIENFPKESIYKHLDLYWQGTAVLLKNFIERQGL